MQFAAYVTGLAAKDTQQGTRIELKLTAQFDTALFAQLGERFTDQVAVAINQAQHELGFEEAGEGN